MTAPDDTPAAPQTYRYTITDCRLPTPPGRMAIAFSWHLVGPAFALAAAACLAVPAADPVSIVVGCLALNVALTAAIVLGHTNRIRPKPSTETTVIHRTTEEVAAQ